MVSIKDKDLYGIAAQEVGNGVIDTGLWAKAFADSGGNDQQAKALYLKMRVLDLSAQRDAQQRQLQQESRLYEQQQDQQRKQLAEHNELERKRREQAEIDAMPFRRKVLTNIVAFIFWLFVMWGLAELGIFKILKQWGLLN